MSIVITRRARRLAAIVVASGALAVAAPLAAHADTAGPVAVTPGSTVCLKVTAFTGLYAGGTATNQGATFSVQRNGITLYVTTPNTAGFAADFSGAGSYKVCAANSNATNTRVTLTALPR